MLFSQDKVAEFVNDKFEAVWESVRPVPVVRIDFGNGNVITRTLHGNIASYVCFADGQLLDVLPGIYAPTSYVERLSDLFQTHQNLRGQKPEQRGELLRKYHQNWSEAQKAAQLARIAKMVRVEAVGKGKIERPVERLVRGGPNGAVAPAPAPPEEFKLDSAEDLASWKALAEDTRINETARRQLIHAWLAKNGSVQPEKIKKWLYKEILHADLDDPYLGLGPTLFASYPFAKEDQK